MQPGPEGRRPPLLARIFGSCVTALAIAAALAGCAIDRGDPAPPPLPEGVTVQLVQLRSDVAARQAQVQVRNDTDEAVEIGAVTVADPRFSGVAERVAGGRSSTIPPGSTVDIRVQLPPMECATEDGSMTVQLGYPANGDAARVEAPLPDPLDVIGPLHARECLAERLSDAAALSLSGFTPSPPGVPADLELTIDPTGDAAAVFGGIQTTNLLTFGQEAGQTDDTFPISIEVHEGDSGATVVHLPLVPVRCDAHAVQEDKRGTIFDIDVELDGEPGEIELAASEDLRGRILTWVADWCGFGS